MGKLDRGRRFDILRRDGFRCRYCGKQAAEAELHVDHLRPRAEGGTDHPSNLVTACADCNGGKRAKLVEGDSPVEWQSLVGRGFSWLEADGAKAGRGVVLSDQGHGYFLVEYLAPAAKRGHRVVHLSTMHEQDWVFTATYSVTVSPSGERPPVLRAIDPATVSPGLVLVQGALAKGEATVAELMDATGLAQPTVSGALARLEEAGVALRTGKRGRAELWRVHEEGDDEVPVVRGDVAS